MKHWKAILALALVLALETGALVFRHRRAAARSAPGTYLIGMSQANLIEMYLIQFFLTFMAYYRHRANIGRLLSGNERKTYLFKTNSEKLDLGDKK